MKITSESSLREVAFIVCSALEEAGVTAVLTGGSAATIWSGEKYQSHDCDFVISLSRRNNTGAQAVADLGFVESGGIYRHPATLFTLDFPPGPLSVGGEVISAWETLTWRLMQLHILTSTDSCRDRLAAFYH